MRLKADSLVIAVTLESLNLVNPIDDALTHGRRIIALRLFDNIFAMEMTNAILGQKIISKITPFLPALSASSGNLSLIASRHGT